MGTDIAPSTQNTLLQRDLLGQPAQSNEVKTGILTEKVHVDTKDPS